MKSYTLPIPSVQFASLVMLLLLTFVPFTSSASTAKPSCELTVQTSVGTVTVTKSDDVLLVKGDEIKISWESKVVKTGKSGGVEIPLVGTATDTPSTTTTYSYHFMAGSKKVVCEVTAHVVTGSITDSTLVSKYAQPTLKGKVTGTKSVQVVVYKEGSKKALYTSNVIRVKNDVWKARISKKLKDGVYDVVLIGEKGFELNTIARETLTVGKVVPVVSKSKTTIVVVPVPLLLGGTARGGMTPSIAYLQVINLGKEPAVVKGFVVKQNGSASTMAVIGLTAVDDAVTVHGSIGGVEGKTPFKDGSVTIPIEVILAPGQMRLFTIKAVLGSNIAQYVGSQLKMDVIGVVTSASIRNTFPLRGTTWTIGL